MAVDLLKDQVFLRWVRKFACFPAGTPVVVGTQDGTYVTRSIEDLKPGDLVLARDEYSEAVGPIRTRDDGALQSRLSATSN